MPEFSERDCLYMSQALRVALNGEYTASPNPCVGCIIVAENKVIGEGWHVVAGKAHAEINALKMAGDKAKGASAYVTLEPCSHEGRTGPCSKAFINAGITSVITAMQDPFGEVSGRGISEMRNAGITVKVGLFEEEARKINRGYLSRIERNRPFVRLKVAASMDGATAMKSGESEWITGIEARRDVQKLRASSDAILTGVGTILNDNPLMNLRDTSYTDKQPLRIILDSYLRTPEDAKIFRSEGSTTIFCLEDKNRSKYNDKKVSIIKVAEKNKKVDLFAVLNSLANKGINNLLVEAGSNISGSFLDENLIDELVIYQSPHIMGSEIRTMFNTPKWKKLGDRQFLDIHDTRVVGKDIRITACPIIK